MPRFLAQLEIEIPGSHIRFERSEQVISRKFFFLSQRMRGGATQANLQKIDNCLNFLFEIY